jgi:hypothetical protein
LIRESTIRHPPSLTAMQVGGGYRILAVLLKEKGFADVHCLDECLACAITGFPLMLVNSPASFPGEKENHWVLSDVDAMKHLLLNHQVWDLQKCGPEIPLRLLSALNVLVSQKALHKSFNARRLHLVGIVRWVLHLMIEGAELYSEGELEMQEMKILGDTNAQDEVKSGWYSESPLVSEISVGGDPGNPFLLECKMLLRRVLTFMLTPGDLEALADAIVFTLTISSSSNLLDSPNRRSSLDVSENRPKMDERILPGPTARLYLVRLLEELVVDGVNEIVATFSHSPKRRGAGGNDKNALIQNPVQYHSGGVASLDQPYLSTSATRGLTRSGAVHSKHQQAQAFLSAFSGFLTPIWFATVLEGCHEEATASAVFRMMVLMIQGSSTFEQSFWAAGGFSPFVLSIPKYSTCPGITLTMLSELLNVPILHLPFFPHLDPEQLCEVFDNECGEHMPTYEAVDASSGIFGLIAECLGRNIKYMATDDQIGLKARATNDAIIHLITHRHEESPAFRQFCATPAFLEPLSQSLCLVYNERLVSGHKRRRILLADIPKNLSPTERFVGVAQEVDNGGIGMVRLLRMVLMSALTAGPRAAIILYNMFRSFPIHASCQQVEALHLILLEQCASVLKEVMDEGDAISIANCVGLCSVLLDEQISAFFAAEANLESVKMSVFILKTLVEGETHAIRALKNDEHTQLVLDAAHLANLICVAALRMSLPMKAYDPGDEDLQAAVLAAFDANVESLLLVPSRDRKSKRRIPDATTVLTKPSQNSKVFPIWQSASLVRCLKLKSYPDLFDNESPQETSIAPLIVILHKLLIASREDVRSLSISLFVALLQHRPNVMSDLLVAEVRTGGQVETIDVVNRGGFRALLATHEAAMAAEKGGPSSSVKRTYASFFEWFDRNINQVHLVFTAVNDRANTLFPTLTHIATLQEDALENEQ